MTDLLWMIPILLAIAVVLGTCRAENLPSIARESGLSMMRLTLGLGAVCVALQVVLFLIPVIF